MKERHFIDSAGVYLGVFLSGALPEDLAAVEIPEPPAHALDTWDYKAGRWNPYEPPYTEKRKKEYLEKLGAQGDQNDAIYKGVMAAVTLLKKLGATDRDLLDAGLVPDKNAEPGTPAHWLGTIADIKTRNPKPDKP